MTEEYKKALYDAFLKNTPIKYESVTDEQWRHMHNSVTGACVALTLAMTKAMKPVIETVNDLVKRLKL